MSSFMDFLESIQKMIVFYDVKDVDMLELGCTLTKVANTCPHKSNDAKFSTFTERDKDLMRKFREGVVGGPSIVFTHKAVVDDTFSRKSVSICKSIVGIDARQL